MKIETENGPGEESKSLFEERVAEYARAVNEGRDGDAEEMLLGMLALAGQEAMENPSQDLVWKQVAGECEELGNWAAAIDAHQKALELAKEHPNPAYPVKSHLDLAGLFRILGRKDESRAHIQVALRLALASEIPTLVAMALDAKLQIEPGSRELAEIRKLAEEALARTGEERIFNATKARILSIQAQCAVGLGEFEAASKLLDGAEGLMGGKIGSDMMTGLHALDARTAEARAAIYAGRGEMEQAIAAISKAVERERTINEQPHGHGIRSRHRLGRVLRVLAEYLENAGRGGEAALARNEAEAYWGAEPAVLKKP